MRARRADELTIVNSSRAPNRELFSGTSGRIRRSRARDLFRRSGATSPTCRCGIAWAQCRRSLPDPLVVAGAQALRQYFARLRAEEAGPGSPESRQGARRIGQDSATFGRRPFSRRLIADRKSDVPNAGGSSRSTPVRHGSSGLPTGLRFQDGKQVASVRAQIAASRDRQ
jgi:hypothetical protein